MTKPESINLVKRFREVSADRPDDVAVYRTRAGTIDVKIPNLGQGLYFPE